MADASNVIKKMKDDDVKAMVLIGGDTAAAVLGDADVIVSGWAGPGAAWATAPGWGAPIVTRSGGFGSDVSLRDLVRSLSAS